MPNPTDPRFDGQQLMGSGGPGAADAGASASRATRPGQEASLVRAYRPTDAAQDPSQVMSAFLQEARCACGPGCCCHGDAGPGERPFGMPPLPVTAKGRDARQAVRRELLDRVAALVRQLNAAHLAGAITPGDLGMLQALQGWYSELLAEQDAAKRTR